VHIVQLVPIGALGAKGVCSHAGVVSEPSGVRLRGPRVRPREGFDLLFGGGLRYAQITAPGATWLNDSIDGVRCVAVLSTVIGVPLCDYSIDPMLAIRNDWKAVCEGA
jgi:hypothetical protein